VAYTIGIDARKAQDFGIGTYIRNLLRHLGELDQDNRYVLFTGATGRDLLSDLPENFHLLVERSPVYSVRELVALSWKLFRLRLDLYHATHYVLPAVVPCRVVVTIHDLIHLLYPDFLPSRLALLYAQGMIRRALARADQVITVSENTKADLLEFFAVDAGKIEVVHNGVEEVFRQRLADEDVERWLRHLGIERPYVLFVGNPKPHKNLDNLVQAYARARLLHPFEARLVCVGARRKAEFKIYQRAVQLGVGDHVHLLGHVAQEALPALYQGADLFLYPTLYEGFGLPVVEAMACGTPVITSNTSSLKEIAEGYAYLVDPLDVTAIAEAIAHCMADPERRDSLGELGRRRSKDFQWRRTAELTLAVYRRALGAGRGNGGGPGAAAEGGEPAT
jgi:glycosyltransferase involved in cell wall biosynthesis